MEGDSVPPPSDMEVGNVAPEAMPVKSMVDYSDTTSADVHHQDQDHYGRANQDDMDQENQSFSNGNGNGADEDQSKDMEHHASQEPKSEPFDVFGKMLSSMPAKPADDEEEGGEVKNENEDGEEKKDTFDKMFDDSTKPSDENEEKKDDQDIKPDGDGEDATKDIFIMQDPSTLQEQNDDKREYSLPYGWKKIGHRRQQGADDNRWDFYLISPCGKKFRSNPEVKKYLDQNPDVECDLDVTNTSRPSDLTPGKVLPNREEAKLKAKKKNEVSKKEKDALVKSPKNFLEENISEAFKTLEVYQKALETERTRCIKTVKEGMSVDTATSITRKLRKLYAVTQKNMDLLDRAIVESFVENFPTESTRIHMGRVAPAQPQYAAPAKRGGGAKSKKKNIKQKLKIKPKKGKKAPAKGKGKKGVIELNGAPDYVEYDLPSSVGKKKRKGYRESDVECIDVSEDDEYYNPKKRSRPGPASSKKGKPGPASKKKSSYY